MPGSRYLWYRWSEGGRRFAVSLKTDSLQEAIQKIQNIKAGRAIVRWEEGGSTERTVMTRLVDDYLTMAQTRAKKPMRPRTAEMVKYVLLKFLRDSKLGDAREITLAAIQTWLEKLRREGLAADTLNRYGNCLRPFTRYLVDKRLAVRGEFDKFEVPERGASGRKNWLKLEEANRVIADSTDQDLTFVLFCGFHAGLRKSEIIAAKVKWFDLEANLLHVQNDPASGFILKDRECRSIPLTPAFREFLRGYLGQRGGSEYCLEPGKLGGTSVYRYDFKRTINSHFKKCGVVCSAHDMRRSFASNLVSHGKSIYKVAKWLGDGVAVVERSYGHLAPADRDIDVLGSSSVLSAPRPSQGKAL
jgi:integrase